jgi:[protein-PII] uridylyltransferase
VFYVINAPTRQAAIKSALLHLLANDESAERPAA